MNPTELEPTPSEPTSAPIPPARPDRRRGRHRLPAALALAAVLAAGACGDDDDPQAGEGSSSSEPAGAPEGETVELTAVDYAFEDVPATISADAEIHLQNDSEGEVHELVAFHLPDGEERDLDELLALPDEEADALLGGPPALVLVAAPGEASFTAVGDGTLSEPGRYILLCAIPTGADPAEYMAAAEEATDGPPPEVAGGPPHFVNGMVADLVVED